MDEYKTSRTCSCCGSELEKVFKSQAAAEKCASQKTEALQRRAKRKADQSMAAGRPAPETPHRLLFPPRPERLIYGVLLCRNCGSRDGRPLFWHRDVNAARNILAVYLSLATTEKRPTAMTRLSQASSTRKETAPTMARPSRRRRTFGKKSSQMCEFGGLHDKC